MNFCAQFCSNQKFIHKFHTFHCYLTNVRYLGKWYAECLEGRTIFNVNGEKCSEFLQGLITNDMKLLINQNILYGMFLNTKGRVLYDTIIYKTKYEDSFLVECDSVCALDLEKHMNLYKLRRKIKITSVENKIWAIFNPNTDENTDSEIQTNNKFHIYQDPRCPRLGYRAILPEDALFPAEKTNSELNYKLHRYNLGIAEGVNELPAGQCFPLEMNCDYLNGVSFNKGCYIGQELTARTHHTGVIRKRLLPLRFTNNVENINMNDPIVDSEDLTKTVGKVRGVSGKSGIGLLKIAEAFSAHSLKTGRHSLICFRPSWWPEVSFKEHVRIK